MLALWLVNINRIGRLFDKIDRGRPAIVVGFEIYNLLIQNAPRQPLNRGRKLAPCHV